MAKSGMNKTDFAERIGVSRNTVQNWKRQNSMPTLAVIERICEVFGITIMQFFGGMGNGTVDKSAWEFIDSWRMLTDKEKEVVSSVIDVFKEAREARR